MSLLRHKPTVGAIEQQVRVALAEDLGGSVSIDQDITACLIPEHQQASATIITREDMVLCGMDWLYATCQVVDSRLSVTPHFRDGQWVTANSTIAEIKGNARALLSAERTILNFIQLLSGTATTTKFYVDKLKGSATQLLDTRKTLPGHRLGQKYAVACGGGTNHRVGLYDAFLIKENHIAACGGINNAVRQARQWAADKPVEVEVENHDELAQALDAGADIVMLDNFSTQQVKGAVAFVNGRCKLEVSGNITVERLQELASTGVDYISSGALTKHVQAIDLSMRLHLFA